MQAQAVVFIARRSFILNCRSKRGAARQSLRPLFIFIKISVMDDAAHTNIYGFDDAKHTISVMPSFLRVSIIASNVEPVVQMSSISKTGSGK